VGCISTCVDVGEGRLCWGWEGRRTEFLSQRDPSETESSARQALPSFPFPSPEHAPKKKILALTLRLDIIKQEHRRRDPPRIPTQRLPRPRLEEHPIDIVEVGEIRVDLHHPVRLHEDDGPDEDQRDGPAEEGFDLDPRDDVVEGPRHVERDGGDG
jgi:hypothetical protein